MTNQISILGNLRLAGALVIDKDYQDFPANPRPGTLCIVGLNLYAYITINGVQAWYPFVQQDLGTATYLHTQVGSSTTWTITHNLNTPADEIWYQVQDNNHTLIDPASMTPIDSNSFQLNFTTGQIGRCVVVGTAKILFGAENIGDGTATQLHNYAGRQLNFIAGEGINLLFDDNTNSVTVAANDIDASTITDAISTSLATVEAAAGLNFDGSYIPPTNATLLTTATSLNNADGLLDAAIVAETNRATTVEGTLSANLTSEIATRTLDVTNLNTTVSANYTALLGVNDALNSEVVNRGLGDEANATAISGEISRATTVETTLANEIAAIAAGAVTMTANALPLANGESSSASIVTTTTTANQIIDSFSITQYRSGKYLIQITGGGQYQIAEVLCLHDGSSPYITEVSDMYTGSAFLCAFDAEIVSGNFNLIVTPAIANLQIKVMSQLINI